MFLPFCFASAEKFVSLNSPILIDISSQCDTIYTSKATEDKIFRFFVINKYSGFFFDEYSHFLDSFKYKSDFLHQRNYLYVKHFAKHQNTVFKKNSDLKGISIADFAKLWLFRYSRKNIFYLRIFFKLSNFIKEDGWLWKLFLKNKNDLFQLNRLIFIQSI